MTESNLPGMDENPEWSADDFRRARPAGDVVGDAKAALLVRKSGRPRKPVAERKQQVTMRFAPDLLTRLRSLGPGWQTKVEDVLAREFRVSGGEPPPAG
jgi:uncharacterized protein (DUF4415 family)